ncbi:unnamed protein product [Prorocentrum cordatum]|uniref:Uncharacterized protein n=1 Tax=Prorocentrum cordatum TaxID=2364126 RepID=A0ABN9VR37_9DINO|nr:unnamed protein product [Polarella glacialis]
MGGAARAAPRRPRTLGAALWAAAAAAAAFATLRGAPHGAFVSAPTAAGASRRAVLALLPLAIPLGPDAARAAGVDDISQGSATPRTRRRAPKGELPKEIDSEGAVFDDWQRTEIISESTLVDPNDPKYKQLRILADMEKQQRKNEAYADMDQETKQQKICELLGRGCM